VLREGVCVFVHVCVCACVCVLEMGIDEDVVSMSVYGGFALP
jgi:hypothetical protein